MIEKKLHDVTLFGLVVYIQRNLVSSMTIMILFQIYAHPVRVYVLYFFIHIFILFFLVR